MNLLKEKENQNGRDYVFAVLVVGVWRGNRGGRMLFSLHLQTLVSLSLYSKPLFSLYFGRLDFLLYLVVLNSVLV